MSADRLARCIGEVDATLVEEALTYKPKPAVRRRRRWSLGAVAACLLAAVIFTATGVIDFPGGNPERDAEVEGKDTYTALTGQVETGNGEEAQNEEGWVTTQGEEFRSDSRPIEEGAVSADSTAVETKEQEDTANEAKGESQKGETGTPQQESGILVASLDDSNQGNARAVPETSGETEKGFRVYVNGDREYGISFSYEGREYVFVEIISDGEEVLLGERQGIISAENEVMIFSENLHLSGGEVFKGTTEGLWIVRLEQQCASFMEKEE